MVTKSGEYYGQPFSRGRGVTQGDPVFPKLFNIIVDAVVRATLRRSMYPKRLNTVSGGWRDNITYASMKMTD